MKTSSAFAALAMTLALSQGEVLAQNMAAAKTYAREPDGKGDPAAITCRRPLELPGKRLLGPEVCRPNADWAQFAKDGMTVSPDGRSLVPSEKNRSLNPAACGPAQMGGGATQGNFANQGMRC